MSNALQYTLKLEALLRDYGIDISGLASNDGYTVCLHIIRNLETMHD